MHEPKALLGSEISEKPIFGFVSGVAALSFAMLLLSTVWIAFPTNEGQAVLINSIIVFVLVADSIFDLYLRLRGARKSIAFGKLRAAFVLAIVSYAALSPFSNLAFPYIFLPHPVNVAGTIAIIFESYVVFGIRSVLFSRSHLYETLARQADDENVSELLSGNARLVFDSFEQAQTLRRTALALFLIATGLTITNGYLLGLPFFVSLWYFLTLVSVFALLSIANSYIDEHRFFAHGIVAPPRFQRIRQNWGYITLIFCVAISLLIGANWSPLKPSDIVAFFAWIASLFAATNPGDFERAREQAERIITQSQAPAIEFPTGTMPKPSPFWPIFFEVAKYVAIVVAVGLAIYFVVRPLLAKEFKMGDSFKLFFSQLGAFFTEPFKALWRTIVAMFRWRPAKRLDKKPKQQTTNPQDYIKSILSSLRPDASGKNRIGIRSLEIYAEFLEWMFAKGLRWTLSDTPYDIAGLAFEFLDKAAGEKSATNGEEPQTRTAMTGSERESAKRNLSRIADILEKDLFSKEHAAIAELDEMNTCWQHLKRSESATVRSEA